MFGQPPRLLAVVVVALGAFSTTISRAQQGPLEYAVIPSAEQAAHLRAAWNGDRPYIGGELIVKFRDGVPATGQTRALSALRGPASVRSARVGDAVVVNTQETELEGASAALARQPEVEWAQPNYWRRLHSRPNDPSYSRQWNFDLLELPRSWDINDGGRSSVTVAVIDSGITTTNTSVAFSLWTGQRFETVSVPFRVNPDLSAARILPGRDFIFWNGPVVDMQGHGTHVAGTVLQETNNSVGLAGIAYRGTLLPLKACIGYWELQFLLSARGVPGFIDPNEDGGCSDSAIAQAIRYAADNGAQVANISIGGDEASPAIRAALEYAVARGLFVAIAMGNEFEDGNPVEYPAAYAQDLDGVVAVGAVGRSSRRSFYSNTGAHLDLMAPGGDSRDGGAAGVIYQTGLFTPDFDPGIVVRPRFDRYAEVGMQGTSMAAPHVAGVAALLFTQGVTQPGAIEALLKHSATDLGAAGRDNDYGYGLINPRAALRGMGLVK